MRLWKQGFVCVLCVGLQSSFAFARHHSSPNQPGAGATPAPSDPSVPQPLPSDPNTSSAPACLDTRGNPLAINDAQVETWEDSTSNGYAGRAHIQGPISRIFPDATGHNHISVQIGATPEDAIEVIYNESFGALPPLTVGQTLEACGDYITSLNAGKHGSPDNAILHWVHKSTSSHKSGYIVVNGVVYGGL
ncbi:MAG: hypothetical protein H7249_00905 [Chitinophagaceae bacterium]|nr:hypothetical protein [Oligoflexus sp.]